MKREKCKRLNNIRFSNPIIKDEIEILYDTKEKLIFRTYLDADGGQVALHYHSQIMETFKVIKGELTVILNTKKKRLKPNEAAQIKPYDTHQFFNATHQAVVFDVEISPANHIIKGLKIFYGLAKEGKVYKSGLPKNILYTAIGLQFMDAYSPNIPRKLQQLGISVLAVIGRVVGVERKLLTKYCN